MALRVVRVSAEVFGTTATGDLRVTRLLAEVAGQSEPDLRLYRLAQQVLLEKGALEETVEQTFNFGQSVEYQIGNLRVVRVSAEVFGTTATGDLRVTRLLAEVAGQSEPDLRLYRLAQQVLLQRAGIPVDATHSLIFGDELVLTFGKIKVTRVVADVLGTPEAELRITRSDAAVLGTTSPELRITRAVASALGTPDNPMLRVHRYALQVLYDALSPPSDMRVTRVAIDVLGSIDSQVRVTRASANVIGTTEVDLRVHRYAVQVLYEAITASLLRITRSVADVLGTTTPDLRLHRYALQVLTNNPVTPVIPPKDKYRMTKSRTMRQLPRRRA